MRIGRSPWISCADAWRLNRDQHGIKYDATEKESRLLGALARKIWPCVRQCMSHLLSRDAEAYGFVQMSGFMMTYKGVPSTYNKDFQEDKEPLFDTVDNVWASLRIAEGVIATLEVTIHPPSSLFRAGRSLTCITQVHADKMREALTMDMLSTDLADYLVRKGVRLVIVGCQSIQIYHHQRHDCRSRSAKHITYRGERSHSRRKGSASCMN